MIAESRTLGVLVDRNADEVYAFISNPENLPQWAPAFCKSVRRTGEDWIVETPDGPMKIRFVERNPFRVADHYVSPRAGVEIYVPMRVVASGSGGSEIIFTLFRQSDMTQEQFRRDVEMLTRDLGTLKRVLER
jgi:carbon monoxide dehydrogenase subunit G